MNHSWIEIALPKELFKATHRHPVSEIHLCAFCFNFLVSVKKKICVSGVSPVKRWLFGRRLLDNQLKVSSLS